MKKGLAFLAFVLMFTVIVACSNANKEIEPQKVENTPLSAQTDVGQTDLENEEEVDLSNTLSNYTIPKLEVVNLPVPQTKAFELTKNLKLGFNLGNTFDAIVPDGVSYTDDPLDIESSWVGIKTTQEMIQKINEKGFQTLRIPVSWHDHVDENYTINEAWLNRVQEVVNYAYDLNMYVIINIHHDNNLDFLYPNYEHKEQSTRYIERIWTQLSERFKDYDEKLIFESMNEPRLVGIPQEWWIEVNNDTSTEPLDVINHLNQTFVDIVRKSGGNNSERYLMVPSYAASPDFTITDKFKLPNDSAANKLILSVHSYSPYHFALSDPSDRNSITTFNPEITAITKDINYFMDNVYSKFIANGIPVVIGEFGARNKGDNTQDRINYAAYYTNAAATRGMPVVWWDNHHFEGDGEQFGIFNRYSSTWAYPEIADALVQYSVK